MFELVTTYHTRLLKSGRPSETTAATAGKPDRAPRLATTPLAKPRYSLNMFSCTIANALQSVVKYYPSQSLTADPIEVEWPYPVLAHHYDELSAFRDATAAKDPKYLCLMERDADKHLSLLLEFLDEHVMRGVKAEQERNKRGRNTWEYTWLQYKPGRTYLEKPLGRNDWDVSVHHSIRGGTFKYPPGPWVVSEWSMVYNGEFLGRQLLLKDEEKYYGEQEIVRYVVDPTDNIDDDNLANLPGPVQEHTEFGKQYYKLLPKQCKQHKGTSRDFPHNQVSKNQFLVPSVGRPDKPKDRRVSYGRPQGLLSGYKHLSGTELPSGTKQLQKKSGRMHRPFSRMELMSADDCRPSFGDGTCAFCRDLKSKDHQGERRQLALFGDYNFIPPEDETRLNNHQHLVCVAEIKVFCLQDPNVG